MRLTELNNTTDDTCTVTEFYNTWSGHILYSYTLHARVHIVDETSAESVSYPTEVVDDHGHETSVYHRLNLLLVARGDVRQEPHCLLVAKNTTINNSVHFTTVSPPTEHFGDDYKFHISLNVI